MIVEMDLSGAVNTFSSRDGVVAHSLPADAIYPVIKTRDMRVDRAVDADGTIRLHVRGWIKVNRPNVMMGVPRPPGQ